MKIFHAVLISLFFILSNSGPAFAQLPLGTPIVDYPRDFVVFTVPQNGQITFLWGAVTNATRYDIEVERRVGTTWAVTETGLRTTVNRLNIFTLVPEYLHRWRVRASNSSQVSLWSSYATFRPTHMTAGVSSFTAYYDQVTKKVKVDWFTDWEYQNAAFWLQRKKSTDTAFANVTAFRGYGTTKTWNRYTFYDSTVTSGTWYYRLVQQEESGETHVSWVISTVVDLSTDVRVEMNGIPNEFSLSQNYPNPFNPTTTISYGLPAEAPVSIVLYSTLGAEVLRYDLGVQPPGMHAFTLDASILPSGTYLYRLEAGRSVDVKKMVLLR